VIDLRPACQAVAKLLDGLTDGQMDLPTPCPEYTVGGLIDHLAAVTELYVVIAEWDSDQEVPAPDPPTVHRIPDWWYLLADDLRDLVAAWADSAAWVGRTNLAGLELANQQWGRIALTEVVVHGWDLAIATGRDLAVPDSSLRDVLAHVTVFVPSAPVPTLFGPPAPVPDGATLLERIVAITGRTPWPGVRTPGAGE
jgi:uncharacterized protein (TIGR03086 family)